MPISKERQRSLKAQAHALKPVVMLGQKGLTEAVLSEIKIALEAHELIKVKVAAEDKEERQAVVAEILTACSAELIGIIGHIAIIYRKKEKK